MNDVRALHQEAMDLAEKAFVAKLKGDASLATQLARQAFEKESKAAHLMSGEPQLEPSRSVLYRSAASLAMTCGEFRQAERLIAAGLAGNPPDDIAQELRDLFDEVNFQRHLELRGVTLEADEVQMSIAGSAVTAGMAPSEELIIRIDDARKLIYRTVERLMGRAYREGGPVTGAARGYDLYISIPRAASFAVSLRVTGPKQPPLPGLEPEDNFVQPSEVIDEIMSCLEYFHGSEEKMLRQKIPQEAYYRNFVGIAKNIAPDGKEVKVVGFTAVRGGKERRVSLTKPRDEYGLPAKARPDVQQGEPGKTTTVTGRLLYADAIQSVKQIIKLIDDTGRPHKIFVPEGMMSDIVRPLWEEPVQVTGFYSSRKQAIVLEDISRVRLV